ncbi:MAG: trypsin-like peptidase domain-containing protein [Lachnospiraceae bacterium]|nr:trypsin-like peptidase domain-containing protein [Lachnospiraceae bacterium]
MNYTYGDGQNNGQYNGGYGTGGYGNGGGYEYYNSNGTPAGGNRSPKKKGNGKKAAAIVGLVMAGIVAGSAVTTVARNVLVDNKPETEETREEASLNMAEAPVESVPETVAESTVEESTQAVQTSQTTGSDENMTVAQIAEKCLSSVVAITNKGTTEVQSLWGTFSQDSESNGSGVIIGETDSELLILTNYHVIENANQLSVVFSWEEESQDNKDEADIINAQAKDYDSSRDIAVIAVPLSELSDETLEKVAVATVGDSDNLELGQQVVAIGNALGYGQSVTTGIISALDREVEIDDGYGSVISNEYIQTDAAINPGNSGGALFNMKGELIGINSAKISSAGTYSASVEGMGYAIPISDILEDVKTMMNSKVMEKSSAEDRGYLGVTIITVDSSTSEAYGIPQGAYVRSVVSGYAADNAGISEGDVITSIDGKSVTEASQLTGYLDYYKAGDTVKISVAHKADGYQNAEEVEVTLTTAPEDTGEAKEENGNEGRPDMGNGGENPQDNGNRRNEEPGDNGNNGGYYDPFGEGGTGNSDLDEWLRQFGF